MKAACVWFVGQLKPQYAAVNDTLYPEAVEQLLAANNSLGLVWQDQQQRCLVVYFPDKNTQVRMDRKI